MRMKSRLTASHMQVRKRTNALDNLLTARAVDALMNYETVKLFTNENLEVGAYDGYLTSYQAAAVETEIVSAKLNAGQVDSWPTLTRVIIDAPAMYA